jgi:hypothetical protein
MVIRQPCDDRIVWQLLAFVLPLGLDSFVVVAALGARRPSRRQRRRLSALLVLFDAGMPLVGLAIGAPIAHLIGLPVGPSARCRWLTGIVPRRPLFVGVRRTKLAE